MPGVNPVNYRLYFDRLYSESLIEIEYFGEAVIEIGEVTDVFVKAKLEESVGVQKMCLTTML